MYLLGCLRGIHVGRLGDNNGNFGVMLSTTLVRVFEESRSFLIPEDTMAFTSIEIPDKFTTIKNDQVRVQNWSFSINIMDTSRAESILSGDG